LDTPPVAEGQVNSRISEFISIALACSGKDILDGSAVLVPELLADLGKHSHAELPVLEFISRAFTSIVLFVRFSLLESCLNLFRPFLEDTHEMGDHLRVWLSSVVDILGFLLEAFVILV
jgi:hypothetical protein